MNHLQRAKEEAALCEEASNHIYGAFVKDEVGHRGIKRAKKQDTSPK